MEITNELIQKWIEEYLAKGYGEKVQKREWKGKYIRGHAPWNNDEDCYHIWLETIDQNLPRLTKIITFSELYQEVKELTIPGIGPLTIYDTATMIGCPNGVYPAVVYLHAGAKSGANAIGIDGEEVPKEDFVAKFSAFEVLEPIQIEDFLCIYKLRLMGKSDTAIVCC